MKTKIIPFDLGMAIEIQKGKTKGKIVRKGAQTQVCEILDFAAEYQDMSSEKFLIVKVPAHDFEKEKLWIYHQDGRAMHSSNCEGMWFDLVLEVPDEPQFKPFDKVLVRCSNDEEWMIEFYCKYDTLVHTSPHRDYPFMGIGDSYSQCIPFEGNEHLLGTTDMCDEQYINW